MATSRRDRFLGRADDPDVQVRAAAARSEAKHVAERRNTVRILRGQGVPAPTTELGRVLDALADAGLFKTAVLVGTAAYQCYSPLVGAALPAAALMTQDADLATASLALAADDGEETLETDSEEGGQDVCRASRIGPQGASIALQKRVGIPGRSADAETAPQRQEPDAAEAPRGRRDTAAAPCLAHRRAGAGRRAARSWHSDHGYRPRRATACTS